MGGLAGDTQGVCVSGFYSSARVGEAKLGHLEDFESEMLNGRYQCESPVEVNFLG